MPQPTTFNSLMKNIRTCVPNIMMYQPKPGMTPSTNSETPAERSQCQDNAEKGQSKIVQLKDGGEGYIKDLQKFKQNLRPLPTHIIQN